MTPGLVLPDGVDDALAALAHHGDEARIMAGGTALMLMMRAGLVQPEVVVSLDRVPGLDRIEAAGDGLRLGARATLRRIETSPLVAARVPVVAQALSLVANVRVRNAATIGGNMAEADYASDLPCVLLALDAAVEVMSVRGRRTIALRDFFVDYYETSLAPDELVTAILIPAPPRDARVTYLKYTTRSCEDRPCLGVAALTAIAPDGTCAELRVAIGAAGPIPYRLPRVEASAAGGRLDADAVAGLANQYAGAASPLSDLRGSREYRRKMIEVFVRRAVGDAAEGRTGARKA